LWLTAVWLLANVFLGYVLTCPLTAAVVCFNYFREDSGLYHHDEKIIAGVIAVVGSTLTLAIAAAINGVTYYRLAPRLRYALPFWLTAVVLLTAPFAWFILATDMTVRQLVPFW
jgi:hypothetical protein